MIRAVILFVVVFATLNAATARTPVDIGIAVIVYLVVYIIAMFNTTDVIHW